MDIPRLHHLTQDHPSLSHGEQAGASLTAGVRLIQFRSKALEGTAKEAEAKRVLEKTLAHGALLIINDDVDLAARLGVGVHLGQKDTPIPAARRILGPGAIIGGTANTADQLLAIQEQGADYAGLGPWRHTVTKEKLSPILGAEGARKALAEARARGFRLPVVLIGGLVEADVAEVLATGAWGLAVSSAINLAVDPVAAAKALLARLPRAPATA